MVVCAGRNCVYAFVIGIFICAQGVAFTGYAKDCKGDGVNPENSSTETAITGFQWQEHQKLSWEDFRGPVNAASDESAAATHCGIGFKVSNDENGRLAVSVYNTFYINKSWVRPDAKIASILVHEQGHFDLCEIYTRKLKHLMAGFDFNVPDVKHALVEVFTRVNNEYEQRQQAYEAETSHGTNIAEQQRWCAAITEELQFGQAGQPLLSLGK